MGYIDNKTKKKVFHAAFSIKQPILTVEKKSFFLTDMHKVKITIFFLA